MKLLACFTCALALVTIAHADDCCRERCCPPPCVTEVASSQAAAVPTAAPSPILVGMKFTVAEMPVAAALSAGIVDVRSLNASQMGSTQFNVVREEQAQALDQNLSNLANQGLARVIATKEYAVQSGQIADFTQLIPSFDFREHPPLNPSSMDLSDLSISEYPGALGLVLRYRPTVDDKNRILLELRSQSRIASQPPTGPGTQPQFGGTEMQTTLRVLSGNAISIGDFMFEEDRAALAALPVVAPQAAANPFFAPPTPGWTLFIIVTPYVIEDK